jgi:hypothetical protein
VVGGVFISIIGENQMITLEKTRGVMSLKMLEASQ